MTETSGVETTRAHDAHAGSRGDAHSGAGGDVHPGTRSGAAVTTLVIGSLVWIGLLIGVSFLATPVKFLAPSLSLPVALDVGRQTFQWFGRVELVLGAVTLLAALATKRFAGRGGKKERRMPVVVLLAAVLLAAVVAQSAWLLPLLDARVEIILGGGMPAPSMLHRVYVAMEAAKLGVLVGVAWIAVGRLRGGEA